MIFLSNAEGVITAAIPEPINQGSVGVNRIVFIAPFPSTAVVSATFILPNGIKIYPRYVGETYNRPYLMGVVEEFVGKGLTIDGVTVNAWQLTLDKAITSVAGNVTVQFLVTTAAGTTAVTDENGEEKTIGVIIPGTEQTLATTSATLPINRGNAYLAPSVSDKDINTIAEYLAAAKTAEANAKESENAAKTAATNAQTAQDYAETSADEAGRAKEAAASSATAASDSATSASGSAESASSSATSAGNSATAASNSASEAKEAQEKAEAAANRASPWDLVITPQNVNDVFADWTRRKVASSILFFNIDFSKLVTGDDAFLVFDDSTRKLEFRGCTFEDEQGNPLKISFYYSGPQCSIEGAKGDELVIQGFTDVIDCRANIIKDCEYVTACDANTIDNCECVTDSTASTFTNCILVDPFTVNGFVSSADTGKVPTLSSDGAYDPKPLPAVIDLTVDNEYKVTATLKDVNGGVISTAIIDLPLESVVVGATVSGDGKKLILTLQNGTTTEIPIENIFQGLATEDWVNAQISDVNTTINGIGTRVTALEDGLETAETDISTLKEDMSAAETEIDELKTSKLDSKGINVTTDDTGGVVAFSIGGVDLDSNLDNGLIRIKSAYEDKTISIDTDGIAGINYDDIARKTEIAPLSEDISNLETQNTILKKRVDNIEGAAIDFVIDSTDAVTKTVPTDALPYAKIMKIGGKTVVEDVPFEGFILKSAPVTELTSYSSDGVLLDTFTIPEAVRPANGINANACDYIAWEADGTKKKYECIGVATAPKFEKVYTRTNGIPYVVFYVSGVKENTINILPSQTGYQTIGYTNDDMSIYYTGGGFIINDSRFTSVEEANYILNGFVVAYELATPIVTDISNILTPDNYIEVEVVGTITAVNGGKGAPTTIYYSTEKTGG